MPTLLVLRLKRWLFTHLTPSVYVCMGDGFKQGDDEGVFISRVTPGGPADLAGLRVHDKVLSVNGISCVNVDHYEAVGILKVNFVKHNEFFY
jgi:C-terminal processing protease CtpA/Prc